MLVFFTFSRPISYAIQGTGYRHCFEPNRVYATTPSDLHIHKTAVENHDPANKLLILKPEEVQKHIQLPEDNWREANGNKTAIVNGGGTAFGDCLCFATAYRLWRRQTKAETNLFCLNPFTLSPILRHHSILLEGELTRRNIPYVKYGGLKFVEAAHVKDLMSFLRLAENPRDLVSGARLLQLLPGIGPKRARQLMDLLIQSGGKFRTWDDATVPPASCDDWSKLVGLMKRLGKRTTDLPSQIGLVRRFYDPILENRYDNPTPRRRDLEQLEQLASPSGTAFGVHEARGAETTRVEEPANVLENVIM